MSPGIPTRLLATQSDERLLALVRQGHERAFEALVTRYRKPLLGYCRRLPIPDARAEDIVQLALLKTWIAVREGAEVRDLKAWLYRVVHNTAVNSLRDSAHDGEPLADPELGLRSHSPTEESELDRGLAMRETLAEVAALPPLQREVIVRTAMAGHSHEQVASDLGITGGAVRGLLYRARTTLRTAITALTPPQLLAWLAGRADQSGPAPERLTELAGGGGAAGLGGLLLKGGVVALTAGTVITGAAVVRISGSTHHHGRHKLLAAAPASAGGAAPSFAGTHPGDQDRELPRTGLRSPHGARAGHGGRRAGHSVRFYAPGGGGGSTKSSPTVSDGRSVPRSTGQTRGNPHGGEAWKVRIVSTPTPPSPPSQGSSDAAGSSPPAGESSAGSSAPGGSTTGSGSAGGAPESGSAGGSGAPTGENPPGAGSGSGGSEGTSSQGGSSSGSETSGAASSEQSGSLVGTVVHEVGGILKHLLQ